MRMPHIITRYMIVTLCCLMVLLAIPFILIRETCRPLTRGPFGLSLPMTTNTSLKKTKSIFITSGPSLKGLSTIATVHWIYTCNMINQKGKNPTGCLCPKVTLSSSYASTCPAHLLQVNMTLITHHRWRRCGNRCK